MATEQPKQPEPVAYPLPPHFQQYNGGTFPPPPPPGVYPPMFAYPPPVDGEGAGPAPAPFVMFHAPPGVVYAYPPPGQPFPVPPQNQSPTMSARSKRKQVKMACTNCAMACKRCDEARPCERCTKYGIAEACVDGQRKERKKGIKRGPYKRKSKAVEESFPESGAEFPPQVPPAEHNGSASPPPPHPDPTAHPLPPEGGPGYYPMYYPPGHFVAVSEGQEGVQPIVSYFMPQYPYPPPFVSAPHPPPQQQHETKPSDQNVGVNPEAVVAASDNADLLSRKRPNSSSGDSTAKRAKTISEGESDAEADPSDQESP